MMSATSALVQQLLIAWSANMSVTKASAFLIVLTTQWSQVPLTLVKVNYSAN